MSGAILAEAGRVSLRFEAFSLFLDLDGTLARFEPLPGEVGPDISRNALLREVANRLNGRMAVISGRSISDLDRILEGTVVSVAGSHGLQRRDARLDMVSAASHPHLAQAVQEISDFAKKIPDSHVEAKPLSVALHYRGNPGAEALIKVFADDLAQRTGLKLQPGNMVVELLSPGMDKGIAIRAYMQEMPFAGTVPVFVGDDLTDEFGFQAVAALGGFGILVGAARRTAARYRLATVDDVHGWLAAMLTTGKLELELPIEPTYRCI